MGQVIEHSTHAYDSRWDTKLPLAITDFALSWPVSLTFFWSIPFCSDDAQNKLVALKEKADKELAQYTTELKVRWPNQNGRQ